MLVAIVPPAQFQSSAGIRSTFVSGAVQSAREGVHAIPDLVEEDVRGDERVALGESLLVRAIEQIELAQGAVVAERDVGESPDALELRGGLLGDLDGPLCRDAALHVVELERVDPGDPQVRERQLGRWALLFERLSRALVVLAAASGWSSSQRQRPR